MDKDIYTDHLELKYHEQHELYVHVNACLYKDYYLLKFSVSKTYYDHEFT